MVDVHALSSRLSALEGYLAELETFRRYSEEEFVEEPSLHHLAERYLHLACETVIDISNHVISERGARQPLNYKDAMEVLREEDLIDQDLTRRLKDWMGFRNVLVHRYLEIDHAESHKTIQQDLGDLEQFLLAMSKLLPKNP